MEVILIEDFHGYTIRQGHTIGTRYYPVYQDDNGYWHYYGDVWFTTVDEVINFFKS